MLFSQPQLAEFIAKSFEPAWQSVRKAAIVRIDFGNGKTVTRTLNGNIATYICMADGRVVDVIPGIYDPIKYRERLLEGLKLHQWATVIPRRPRPDDPAAYTVKVFKQYHTEQSASIRENKEPKLIAMSQSQSIFGVEHHVSLVLKSSLKGKSATAIARRIGRRSSGNRPPTLTEPKEYKLPSDLGSRVGTLKPESLKKDSDYNESVRRLKVHDYLAKHGPVTPDSMTKWLYKNVLDTDLDDPYLGLGKTLFATYPFAGEDKQPPVSADKPKK